MASNLIGPAEALALPAILCHDPLAHTAACSVEILTDLLHRVAYGEVTVKWRKHARQYIVAQ